MVQKICALVEAEVRKHHGEIAKVLSVPEPTRTKVELGTHGVMTLLKAAARVVYPEFI